MYCRNRLLEVALLRIESRQTPDAPHHIPVRRVTNVHERADCELREVLFELDGTVGNELVLSGRARRRDGVAVGDVNDADGGGAGLRRDALCW